MCAFPSELHPLGGVDCHSPLFLPFDSFFMNWLVTSKSTLTLAFHDGAIPAEITSYCVCQIFVSSKTENDLGASCERMFIIKLGHCKAGG